MTAGLHSWKRWESSKTVYEGFVPVKAALLPMAARKRQA
jgi:hypothetical protein